MPWQPELLVAVRRLAIRLLHIRYSSECSQSADGVPAAQRSIQPPVESSTWSCPFTYVLLFLFALEMSLVILNHAMVSSSDCGSKYIHIYPDKKVRGANLRNSYRG